MGGTMPSTSAIFQGPSDDPAEVLASCCVDEAHVEVKWQNQLLTYPPEMEKAAADYWHRLCAEVRPRAHLFDGPLCALRDFHCQGDRLILSLARTSYRYALFANDRRQEIVRRWGSAHVPTVLGVSAVVTASDGVLPLGRRSDQVGEFPGMLDVFGGHIDPEADLRDGVPDPCTAIRHELGEELDLRPEEVTSLRCIGLTRSRCNQKPELIFACRVPLDFGSLVDQARRARGAGEFVTFLQVADQGATLGDFLKTHRAALTPSAYGSLWLYGAHRGFWHPEGGKTS